MITTVLRFVLYDAAWWAWVGLAFYAGLRWHRWIARLARWAKRKRLV